LLFIGIVIGCGYFIVGFKYISCILKTFSNTNTRGYNPNLKLGRGRVTILYPPHPYIITFSKKKFSKKKLKIKKKKFKNYNYYNFFTYLFAFVIYFTYLCT